MERKLDTLRNLYTTSVVKVFCHFIHFVFSMWWDYTEVTIKRLHRDIDPFQGGVVDLLINEIEHIGYAKIYIILLSFSVYILFLAEVGKTPLKLQY